MLVSVVALPEKLAGFVESSPRAEARPRFAWPTAASSRFPALLHAAYTSWNISSASSKRPWSERISAMLLAAIAAPITSPIRTRASRLPDRRVRGRLPSDLRRRIDPEVVERVRLPEQVPELLVDRKGEIPHIETLRAAE